MVRVRSNSILICYFEFHALAIVRHILFALHIEHSGFTCILPLYKVYTWTYLYIYIYIKYIYHSP